MGKIIQKQAKMERISQYSINEKPLFWTLLNVVNSIKRRVGMMDTHRKHAPKGTCFLCVPSARTASETSLKGDDEVLRSTACWEVVPPPGLSKSWTEGENDWKKSTACWWLWVSSTKTAHETSTGCEVELISYKNYSYWIKCILMIN